MGVQGHAAVVEVLVKRGLADAQAASHIVDAQRAGPVEQFGGAGRALGFCRYRVNALKSDHMPPHSQKALYYFENIKTKWFDGV